MKRHPHQSPLDRRRLAVVGLLLIVALACAITMGGGGDGLAPAPGIIEPGGALAAEAPDPVRAEPAEREAPQREGLTAEVAPAATVFFAYDIATDEALSGVTIRLTPVNAPEDLPAPDLDGIEATPGVSYASLGVTAQELRRPFAVPAAGQDTAPPPPATLATDVSGTARYAHATEPLCGWLIEVEHPTWHALRSTQWVRHLPARSRLPMAARLELTVAVRHHLGTPVEGASVSLIWPALPHAFYWRNLSTKLLGRSDVGGEVSAQLAQDLPDGIHIAVGHPDHAPMVVPLALDKIGKGKLRAEVSMDPGIAWHCQIVDDRGRGVPGCGVQLMSKSTLLDDWDPDFMPPALARRYGLQRAHVTTDANGRATVHGWPSGAAARLMVGTATARLLPIRTSHGAVELLLAAGDDKIHGVEFRPAAGMELLVQVEIDRPPEIHVQGVVQRRVPPDQPNNGDGALRQLLAGPVVRVHLIWNNAPRSTAFASIDRAGSFRCTLPVPRMIGTQLHVALQHLDQPEVRFGPYTVREGMSIGGLVLPN